ncbi:unnamed protein product, partial [marine sediment metagenome]
RGEFKPSTWDAFWQCTVKAVPPKTIADRLRMSVGAVYIAKSRVLSRVRQRVREIAEEEDLRLGDAL